MSYLLYVLMFRQLNLNLKKKNMHSHIWKENNNEGKINSYGHKSLILEEN